MPYITVGKENSGNVDLYYEDHGDGRPVVLIHGWPLSSASWEKQLPALLEAGFRVIAYDRRGFGLSAKPATGYEYDKLAADLDQILTKLDLHDVALVGFSMGGGEVARYLGKFGSERVSKTVFMSAITPALLKGPDNEEGVDADVFEGMRQALVADRPAFLTKFFKDFYNLDKNLGRSISEDAVRASWNVASLSSPIAAVQCVTAWGEDFREDVKSIDVPTLVVHGTADRIVPIDASANRMPELIRDCKLVTVEGAPHGLSWTHAEEANRALLEFLGATQKAKKPVRQTTGAAGRPSWGAPAKHS